LAAATVTLSGTITRVMQTDFNGNYFFANLISGRHYSVALQRQLLSLWRLGAPTF